MLFTLPGTRDLLWQRIWLEALKPPRIGPEAAFEFGVVQNSAHQHDLRAHIGQLAAIRASVEALRTGAYAQRLVASKQFVFERVLMDQHVIVAVNADSEAAHISLAMPAMAGWRLFDAMNNEFVYVSEQGKLDLSVPGYCGLILVNG